MSYLVFLIHLFCTQSINTMYVMPITYPEPPTFAPTTPMTPPIPPTYTFNPPTPPINNNNHSLEDCINWPSVIVGGVVSGVIAYGVCYGIIYCYKRIKQNERYERLN